LVAHHSETVEVDEFSFDLHLCFNFNLDGPVNKEKKEKNIGQEREN